MVSIMTNERKAMIKLTNVFNFKNPLKKHP